MATAPWPNLGVKQRERSSARSRELELLALILIALIGVAVIVLAIARVAFIAARADCKLPRQLEVQN
ncbi:MAG TPA: hypothetical protein DEQ47_11460 [Solibacterales bacterium]|nr:hypothetical protein [Bryobacterales bacterium]